MKLSIFSASNNKLLDAEVNITKLLNNGVLEVNNKGWKFVFELSNAERIIVKKTTNIQKS
jgi:hypothetical protein